MSTEDEKLQKVRIATKMKKEMLLKAMIANVGNITASARQCGVSAKFFYDSYKADENFRAAIDEIDRVRFDFADSKLWELINGVKVEKTGKDGESRVYRKPPCKDSIFFVLSRSKTGRALGYGNKIEVDNKVSFAHLTDEELEKEIEKNIKALEANKDETLDEISKSALSAFGEDVTEYELDLTDEKGVEDEE